ncbi:tigger transposable element-derived protein 6-like [Stegodyphus dumicola]|uniref:tigger transposable element-derived protein 6-like n=1 Tax=Stegodyphus dumicola TaxID=202533 RepID=UPI0015B2B9A9|nr:tigger transposable element-derived protein 6-like [Stegodyphus dumicola]
MPRNDLTLSSKIALLDKIKSQPPNTSYRRLAEITGVPKSTISRVLRQESQLREELVLQEGQAGTSKRKREGKDPDVEEALDQWFSIVSGRGVNINGPILKAKSEELAKKLGRNDFKATDGWLSRWKTRHNIKFKKAHGEKGSADKESSEQWKTTKIPTFLENFCADDIYNADETGLYYRATPDGSLCYKHIALTGYKKAMDRITVLCCTNMSGTDKRKLLIIGKSARPRCFKGLSMEGLPVEYHANKNAWMTSEIFRNWLTSWDRNLQHKKRKILLIVDNCAAHPHLDNLQNIQLEFLPPNTTSLMQPMDMGVIKNFKTLYRGKLVNYILESIDENLLTTSTTAREISSKISLLQAIQFVADSWRAIKATTIQNCFTNCGFKPLEISENLSNEENEDMLQVPICINYEEFSTIDNNLPCYDDNENCEDSIVEGIKSKHGKLDEDDDDDDESPVPVTNQEAKKCIATLQRYFMQEGNEGSPASALYYNY